MRLKHQWFSGVCVGWLEAELSKCELIWGPVASGGFSQIQN